MKELCLTNFQYMLHQSGYPRKKCLPFGSPQYKQIDDVFA